MTAENPIGIGSSRPARKTPASVHVGVTEIGAMLGVSRQRANQLTNLSGFPRPVDTLAQGRIWRRRNVASWARKTGRAMIEGRSW
jgi:hypothetical protein